MKRLFRDRRGSTARGFDALAASARTRLAWLTLAPLIASSLSATALEAGERPLGRSSTASDAPVGEEAGEGPSWGDSLEALRAELEEATGLRISGFFDVVARDVDEDQEDVFEMGNFELDIEASLSERLEFASAIVVNDEGAELAVAFVDLSLGGRQVPPRGRVFDEPGYNVQLGRSDLPFGIDYQYFAAPDRANVSAPLTTELLLEGGLNETGLRYLQATRRTNATLYAVNGLEGGLAAGGRFGLRPFPRAFSMHGRDDERRIELGASAFVDYDSERARETTLFGVDLEAVLARFTLQGEYVRRENEAEGIAPASELEAWYLALKVPIGEWPLYSFLRWEELDAANEDTERWTAALGYVLEDVVGFKFEYSDTASATLAEEGPQWLAQATISF